MQRHLLSKQAESHTIYHLTKLNIVFPMISVDITTSALLFYRPLPLPHPYLAYVMIKANVYAFLLYWVMCSK